MTLEHVEALLRRTGLPVTYRAWPEKQAPVLPWLCYLTPYTHNFAADGVAYCKIEHVQVELYSRYKDPGSESKVETVLSEAGIYWDRSQEYLDDEKCYQTIYEIEV